MNEVKTGRKKEAKRVGVNQKEARRENCKRVSLKSSKRGSKHY